MKQWTWGEILIIELEFKTPVFFGPRKGNIFTEYLRYARNYAGHFMHIFPLLLTILIR